MSERKKDVQRPQSQEEKLSLEMTEILQNEIFESEIKVALDAAFEEGVYLTHEQVREILNLSPQED